MSATGGVASNPGLLRPDFISQPLNLGEEGRAGFEATGEVTTLTHMKMSILGVAKFDK